jgi:hypothetical protein
MCKRYTLRALSPIVTCAESTQIGSPVHAWAHRFTKQPCEHEYFSDDNTASTSKTRGIYTS